MRAISTLPVGLPIVWLKPFGLLSGNVVGERDKTHVRTPFCAQRLDLEHKRKAL
ncbi:MAG: hypothetical protein AAGG69_08065 [Pseudomonadota bacterium]